MKKSILTAIFTMAIVFSASAQDYKWFIGGKARLWSGKSEGIKTTFFEIAPEVGYNVSSNFAVAASVSYQNTNAKQEGSDVSVKASGFVLNPYLRYTFLKSGIVSAFVDGSVHVGLGDIEGFQIGLAPGVAIALTDRFSAALHFGFLGYTDGKGAGTYSVHGKGFGLDFSGYQSSIGFYYSF